jgi:hypothetical protein
VDRALPAVIALCDRSLKVASNFILTEIARFDRQVTGVTVAEDGRIFVNFPRWTEDATISVAEVTGEHTFTPYPDEAWTSW